MPDDQTELLLDEMLERIADLEKALSVVLLKDHQFNASASPEALKAGGDVAKRGGGRSVLRGYAAKKEACQTPNAEKSKPS